MKGKVHLVFMKNCMQISIKFNKTVLLTGGTGFIGRHIAHQLIKDGVCLRLLIRKRNSEDIKERVRNVFRSIIPQNTDYNDSYEVLEGDIKEQNLLLNDADCENLKNKIDEVWHCAAALSFEEKNAKETKKVNVEGTKNVLDLACRIGARKFHFISTAYVCGDRIGKVFETELDCDQKLRNPYEESKFEAEKLVKRYEEQYKLYTTIYRPSIVVGNSKTGYTSSFAGYYYIARLLHHLKTKISNDVKKNPKKYITSNIYLKNSKLYLPIRILCSNSSTVNLINVDYVAELITSIAKNSKSNGKAFHVVNPAPPACSSLYGNTLDILGINGCKLVNLSEFIESKPADVIIAKIENDLYKSSELYVPYLLNEPEFDTTNVERILGIHYKQPPKISREMINHLLSYAIQSNFGHYYIKG